MMTNVKKWDPKLTLDNRSDKVLTNWSISSSDG